MSGSIGDDEMTFFGGVYAAIPSRLIIGPYTHAEAFATKSAGFPFAETTLPDPSHRYVISCLLPSSALPAPTTQGSPTTQSSTSRQNTSVPSSPSVNGATSADTANQAPEKSDLASGLPEDPKEAIAHLSSKAADFIAQLNARRQQQQQRSTAGSASTTAGMPASFSRSVEKARGRRAEQQQQSGGSTLFPAAGAPESVVRQLAQDNEDIRRTVEGALGGDHFLQCAVTRGNLDEILDVQEAMDFIRKALASHPEAVVYMYSQSGRNRASAVAMYYLQREEKLPLKDIFPRMPTSTPQVSFLTTLMNADKVMHGDGKTSFDEDEYFYLYFTRRYPQKSSAVIKAAISTRPGDFGGVDKLLHDEFVFSKSSANSAARAAAQPGDSVVSGSNASFPSRGAAVSSMLSVHSGVQSNPNASFGSLDDGAPIVLTAINEEIISTLCKALQKANVAAGYDDIKESYVRNRRAQNRVLREFLAKDGIQAAGKVDWYGARQTSSGSSLGSPGSQEVPVNAGGMMPLPTMVNAENAKK